MSNKTLKETEIVIPKSATLIVKFTDDNPTNKLPEGEFTEAQKRFIKSLVKMAVQEYIQEQNGNLSRGEHDCILRLKEVTKRIGLARSSVYALIREGAFPEPIRLGTHSVGWKESVIIGWLQDRAAKSKR